MGAWLGFYTVIAGVAATLVGLLFVAISINAALIFGEADQSSRRMAEQAFQNYFAVLMVSLLAIFPTMDVDDLGRIVLAGTAVWGTWLLIRLYRGFAARVTGKGLGWLRRQLLSLAGFVMLAVASVQMGFHLGESLKLFASAILILLLSAAAVSWELLRRIAADKAGIS